MRDNQFNPENMEFVCPDANSHWYYNKEDDKYYRFYPATKECSRISAKNLPDPHILLASRIKAVGGAAQSPSDASYALWEHKNTLLQNG